MYAYACIINIIRVWQLKKKAENSKKKIYQSKHHFRSLHYVAWLVNKKKMTVIHFPVWLVGSYMETLLNPIRGRKAVAQDPCYFWNTWSKSPPLPCLSEIVPLVFISVNCLNYFLAHYLQVVHVPIFLY